MTPPPLKITSFQYKPSFKKDIKRLDKRIQDDIENALKELENGNISPGRQLKKLTDSNQIYSMRIGKDYRLSFQLENQTRILRRAHWGQTPLIRPNIDESIESDPLDCLLRASITMEIE